MKTRSTDKIKNTIFSKKTANPWLVLDQSFFAMFLTFSLIELTNVGAGLIDGLIVSNCLDSHSMAAVGIAHPIFSISGIFAGMFVTGMQTLCTRALGRGDVEAFNRLFSAVMILGTIFSLAVTALLLIGATPVAMLLGASGKGASLAAPAAQYLRGIGIGLPGLIMTGVLAAGIHMDGGRRRVMIAAIICSGMNKDLRKASDPEAGDSLLRARPGRGIPLTTWMVRVIHDRTFTGKNCAMPGTQKTGPDTTAKCDIRSFCKSVFSQVSF